MLSCSPSSSLKSCRICAEDFPSQVIYGWESHSKKIKRRNWWKVFAWVRDTFSAWKFRSRKESQRWRGGRGSKTLLHDKILRVSLESQKFSRSTMSNKSATLNRLTHVVRKKKNKKLLASLRSGERGRINLLLDNKQVERENLQDI